MENNPTNKPYKRHKSVKQDEEFNTLCWNKIEQLEWPKIPYNFYAIGT